MQSWLGDVPLKLGLKLTAVIGAYGLNPKMKFIDDVVNKINRSGLIVLLIDF